MYNYRVVERLYDLNQFHAGQASLEAVIPDEMRRIPRFLQATGAVMDELTREVPRLNESRGTIRFVDRLIQVDSLEGSITTGEIKYRPKDKPLGYEIGVSREALGEEGWHVPAWGVICREVLEMDNQMRRQEGATEFSNQFLNQKTRQIIKKALGEDIVLG